MVVHVRGGCWVWWVPTLAFPGEDGVASAALHKTSRAADCCPLHTGTLKNKDIIASSLGTPVACSSVPFLTHPFPATRHGVWHDMGTPAYCQKNRCMWHTYSRLWLAWGWSVPCWQQGMNAFEWNTESMVPLILCSLSLHWSYSRKRPTIPLLHERSATPNAREQLTPIAVDCFRGPPSFPAWCVSIGSPAGWTRSTFPSRQLGTAGNGRIRCLLLPYRVVVKPWRPDRQ